MLATTFHVACVAVSVRDFACSAKCLLNEEKERVLQYGTQYSQEIKEKVKRVGRLTQSFVFPVVSPLLPLALLVTARLPFFDRWGWPVVLIGYLLVLAVIPIAAFLVLHGVCRFGKSGIVKAFKDHNSDRDSNDIENIDDGAFAVWRVAVVWVVLLPLCIAAVVMVLVRWTAGL